MILIAHRESSSRLERLLKVYDLILKYEFEGKIYSFEDYKGLLKVVWIERPIKLEMLLIKTSWEELNETEIEHYFNKKLIC